MRPLKTPQERLVYAMRQQKMKITVLAKSVGVSDSAVSRWRTASDMDQQNLMKVCQAMNIRADWLLFGNGAPNRDTKNDLTPPEYELVSALRSAEAHFTKPLTSLFRAIENVLH